MIDELMKNQDDFGFDDLLGEPLLMHKTSSYTVGPDGSRVSMANEEEIRKIREQVEKEKEERLKQFQDIYNQSITEVKASPNLKESSAWVDLQEP